MVQRVNVQAFVFTKNPCFKVLILKRTPERGGYWQSVSGGVDNGEGLQETVSREIFEETGVKVNKSILDLQYTFIYKATKNGILMDMQDYCFAVEIDNVADIELSDEHESYKWCSYADAKKYLKWEHNLVALEKLINLAQ